MTFASTHERHFLHVRTILAQAGSGHSHIIAHSVHGWPGHYRAADLAVPLSRTAKRSRRGVLSWRQRENPDRLHDGDLGAID